ncbi:hypothetical protein BC936DRAFT_136843 [Jimgerdemannia flammicorona]|uniref:Little elongation complex subunit 2 C-terminal domain-containing protein n=1 Tax=Jimgerdemannia flammicorona TaxID=994334 RepID=A0A433CYP1_9FUNG|nr:hypothetical protein BC936DRAFT_136843 [Jimgerdemannia flammicorona]
MMTALAAIGGDNVLPSPTEVYHVPPPSQRQHGMPYSRLTKEEHLRFLQAEELLRTNPSLVSDIDRTTHQRHVTILAEEREAFREWQRERAKETDLMNELNISIKQQVDRYLETKRCRVIEQYPGSWCRCVVPNLADPIKIPLDREYWATSASGSPAILNENMKVFTTKCVFQITPAVSKDPIIPPLLAQRDIHVVISSGALAAIVELQSSLDTEWEIPVTVVSPKEFEGGNTSDKATKIHPLPFWFISVRVTCVVLSATVKTIYIDKPLLKKRMTPRERNQKFYGAAFKSMCLDFKSKSDVNDNRVLSEHPSDEKEKEIQRESDMAQVPSPSFPPPIGSSIRSPNLEPIKVTDSIPDIEMADANVEQAKQQPYDGENLTYTLWSFGELDVLVRYRSDGYVSEAGPDGKIVPRTIGLKTKLEYQLDEGWWEETTTTERARSWIYSYVRGHAHILVARFDVLRNEVIRVERRQMIDIFEGKWNPMPYSKLLHHLFTKLYALSPGTYLVAHKKGDWNVTVYKSTPSPPSSTSTSLYDLHDAHRSLPSLDGDSISTFVPAWGGPKGQVPWTFPPGEKLGTYTPSAGIKYCFQFADTGTCSKSDVSRFLL